MGAGEEFCIDHSGCKKAIDQLEKDRDADRKVVSDEIFPRLRDLERYMWQQSARTGLVTAVAVLIGQFVLGKLMK